jgi:hypothetical protein
VRLVVAAALLSACMAEAAQDAPDAGADRLCPSQLTDTRVTCSTPGIALGVCELQGSAVACLGPCDDVCSAPGEQFTLNVGSDGVPLCYCGSPFQ